MSPTMRSIAQELTQAAADGQVPQFGLKHQLRYNRVDALVVAVDNGNDAFKGAILTPDGQLITARIPAAYTAAEQVQAGQQEVTYGMDGATFWIGGVALAHEGQSLPIGSTRQRLQDARLRQFLAASLVELLVTAGYSPGEYPILLGFAIPNNEIVPIDAGDRLGVDLATRAVLEQHIKGATWTILRAGPDERGEWATQKWTLHVLTVMPQAQTAGTVLVVTKAPSGRTITDIAAMTVIDIGGGDLQRTNVSIDPYQMISTRVGDGTIRIARALKARFSRMELTDVAAQQALITRRLLVGGRYRDISDDVEAVKAAQGQALIAAVLPELHQSNRFVVITGGGVILLNDLLLDHLMLEQKIRGTDYEIMNHGISATLNAVGALFGLHFMLSKR